MQTLAKIEVQDADENRVINAFTAALEYKNNIVDVTTGTLIPNPESKKQFIKRKTQEWFRRLVVKGEADIAAKAAHQAAKASAEAIAITT